MTFDALGLPGLDRLRRSRFARDAGLTYLATAATLAVNLAAGIVIARSLGPSGRGVLAAILTLAQVVSTIFSVGATAAIAYHLARHPADGGRLLSTWLLMLLPITAVATALAILVVPVLFAAQSEHAQDLARLYMLTLVVLVLVQPLHGLITGERRTGLWSVIRVLQPAVALLAVSLLAFLDELSVETGLLATISSVLLAGIVAAVPTLGRHGLGRPDARLGWSSLLYGLRGLGAVVSHTMNMRLDLLIMPAVLSAYSVGLYSVATNVSWLVVAASSPLWWLVMPAAAAQEERGSRTIVASFYLTLAVGGALAALLAASSSWLVPAVYGESFSDAVTPLLLLLPGSVLMPATSMVTSGIYAAGRPFSAAVPYGIGALCTVIGLVLFLEKGGIDAAAAITSLAYVLVFVISVLVYRRVAELTWRDLSPMRLRGEPTA